MLRAPVSDVIGQRSRVETTNAALNYLSIECFSRRKVHSWGQLHPARKLPIIGLGALLHTAHRRLML
ncbi:hypothetical protein D3C84_568090 [compost metagenome]